MPTLSPLSERSTATQGREWLRGLLEAFPVERSVPGLDDPLREERSSARRVLDPFGLPGRRQEAWRFTDPSLLAQLAPRPIALESVPQPPLPAPGATTCRLHLGSGDALLPSTLPEGIHRLQGPELEHHLGRVLAETGAGSHWCVRLNSAIASEVLALRIRGPVANGLELVSHAAHLSGVMPLRLLLVLEDGASLTLLQVHQTTGPSLTSVVVEAQLGRGARLNHGVVARGSDSGALLAVTAVSQARDSHYTQTSLCSGWGLARQEPVILQRDGQASTRLRGLHWVDGGQIADTHSQVRFSGPEGTLDQLHKVVADGEGRSVFNGSVQVPRQAQRTNACQLSRGLLLSAGARIDTKPELEIVADDVRCTHGATISRLRQEELFYLRSRGLASAQASRLLLRGFCEEVRAELPEAAGIWNPLAFLQPEVR
jgi:FeS assembly protein SufD